MENLGLIIVIAVAVVASISVVLIFVNNYKKAEPNEALIFTGRKNKVQTSDGAVAVKGWRAVVGGAKLKIPVLEKINRISLKTMNLADVRVEKAYSKEGVPVTIDAVANVKISGEEGMLDRAVERFLGTESRQVQQIIKETLARGEDVRISGFGKFQAKFKWARRGRNPQTGEMIILNSRRIVTFRASKKLREKVNLSDHEHT